jgi:hypothetical protein
MQWTVTVQLVPLLGGRRLGSDDEATAPVRVEMADLSDLAGSDDRCILTGQV